jgi:hypothetical protein
VVPPARVEDSNEGDWRMEKSCPWIVTSTVVERESTNPRFAEGICLEKSMNDSVGQGQNAEAQTNDRHGIETSLEGDLL